MVEIFMRISGKGPVLLETVDDAAAALGRLIVLCATEPGDYFAVSNAEIISEVSTYEEPSYAPRLPEKSREIRGGAYGKEEATP